MGWFDANPANLDNLPPTQTAKGYIELAGGENAVIQAAEKAYAEADYRWAAELLKHVLNNNPNNKQAINLQIKTFSQLGYMSEASTWRNFYLTGALELSSGAPTKGVSTVMLLDMLHHTPIEHFLESIAASLNADRAKNVNMTIHLVFSDLNENYQISVKNSVMYYKKVPKVEKSDVTLTLTKPFFLQLVTGQSGGLDLVFSKSTKIEGSRLDLRRFFSLIDKSNGTFPIVTRK